LKTKDFGQLIAGTVRTKLLGKVAGGTILFSSMISAIQSLVEYEDMHSIVKTIFSSFCDILLEVFPNLLLVV
jgi:hypothetical protein